MLRPPCAGCCPDVLTVPAEACPVRRRSAVNDVTAECPTRSGTGDLALQNADGIAVVKRRNCQTEAPSGHATSRIGLLAHSPKPNACPVPDLRLCRSKAYLAATEPAV